jgi:hypothetical protein
MRAIWITSVYIVLHDWRSSPISVTGRPMLWSVASDYIVHPQPVG